jgi:hypothetical protein
VHTPLKVCDVCYDLMFGEQDAASTLTERFSRPTLPSPTEMSTAEMEDVIHETRPAGEYPQSRQLLRRKLMRMIGMVG